MPLETFAHVEEYLALRTAAPSHKGEARLRYVKEVLQQLGSPQDAVPVIHVAGTSGKGSTVYYATAILTACGYHVGSIVSPHVNSVAERSQINGALLTEVEYCRYFAAFVSIITELDVKLTYIEFLVIFSFWLFAQQQVDYVVVEVGVGGRLDVTNVLGRPDKVAVITDIGLDHIGLLGDTVVQIAAQKAGIITPGSAVVMHQQDVEIVEVIKGAAAAQGATLEVIDGVVAAVPTSVSLPSYQVRNSMLALAAVRTRLSLDHQPAPAPSAIARALTCAIPGRFERCEIDGAPALLDVAHNPQKMGAFVRAYQEAYPATPCVIVAAFGANKSDTVAASLRALRGISTMMVVTEFTVEGMDRASLDAQTLAAMATEAGFEVTQQPDPQIAATQAAEWARQHDAMVVVTGSFYLVSQLRATSGK